MTDVKAILSRDAACIDSWLSTYFDKCNATANARHLVKAMRYSAKNGGKRLRGSLVLSAARITFCIDGPPEPMIIPVETLLTSLSSNPESLTASVIEI